MFNSITEYKSENGTGNHTVEIMAYGNGYKVVSMVFDGVNWQTGNVMKYKTMRGAEAGAQKMMARLAPHQFTKIR